MKRLLILALASILLISACTKNTDQPGRLIVRITDDPFPINYVESATVTITGIELRKAGEHEGNPFIMISDDTFTFDLLKLRNGITAVLADLEIPQGKYDLIRLYVEDAGLRIKGHESPFHTKVPSGMQTGIKIFVHPAITVEGGLTSELLLDFDLARSFVLRGKLDHPLGINGFIFKPCIRASNISTSGRIEGTVSDTLKVKLANAKVWISQDTVISTAFTDTLGYYAFIGVPGGIYSVSASRENYDTVSYTSVKVVPGNRTITNFALTKK